MSIELSNEQTSTIGQRKNNFIWLCILNNVTYKQQDKINSKITEENITKTISVLLVIISWLVLRSSFRPGQGTHQRPFCLANSVL